MALRALTRNSIMILASMSSKMNIDRLCREIQAPAISDASIVSKESKE